ncbi:uncharacterized protein TEOVI_000626200 [Trypanosoma equiperdum]|uniref:Uncharacterized protein n=1 Tax=Trypanosoma equiperdum TaxID=5694 RepID=A0A1G4I7W1_TRYEQ|nr:hypothetical protein TEOVI_000626200 [Trypanosoma equiperdum]
MIRCKTPLKLVRRCCHEAPAHFWMALVAEVQLGREGDVAVQVAEPAVVAAAAHFGCTIVVVVVVVVLSPVGAAFWCLTTLWFGNMMTIHYY